MGYSDDHDLLWEDFPCKNYTSPKLFVGFLCEEEQVDVTTGFALIIHSAQSRFSQIPQI